MFLVKFVVSLISGTFLGVTAASFFLNSKTTDEKKNEEETTDEGEGEEEEGEEGEEGEEYTTKYYEEFSRLPERELTSEDLVILQTKILRETTPGGEVIMTYDKDTETFCYYTNQLKEISYEILDAVAQKFVMTYNCKKLCIDTKAEQTRVEERRDERVKARDDKARDDKARDNKANPISTAPENKTIFAKFKNYNKNSSTPEFNANVLVKERSNHFRYRGKLYEYEEIEMRKEKEKEKEKQEIKIDYTAFKQMMQTTISS
jgi:hypothetical protein